MKKMHLIILVFSVQLFFGQQKNTLENKTENVFLHLNTTTLVTGETLLYNAYCLNKTGISNYSKIIYVELLNEQNTSIFKHKLFLKNGTENGSFFVNPKLKNGKYKLIAYTKWMQNMGENSFFYKQLNIINPFEKATNNNDIYQINATDSSKSITYKPKKKRTEINLNEFLKDTLSGIFSISVKKKNNITFDKIPKIENHKEKNNIQNFNTTIASENRGEIISGYISTNSESSLENKTISLTINGEEAYLLLVQTDKKGSFIFNLVQPLNTKKICIEVFEKDKENFEIHLDKIHPINYDHFILDKKTDLKPNYAAEIEQKTVHAQIENAYYEAKKDSLVKPNPIYAINPNLFKEYILNKYTHFPTLKETIIEIIDELHFKEKDGNFTLHLRSYDELYNPNDEPLLMVDGTLIQNTNELLDLKSINVDKISIIKERYIFGGKYFGGVVFITTKEKNYQSSNNEVNLLNYIAPNKLIIKYSPNYNKEKLERIPDYRNQLLWLNNIKNINKGNEIKFFTSEVSGVFEIIIQGVKKNGDLFYFEEAFEVNE